MHVERVRARKCLSVRRTIPKEVMCSGEHFTLSSTSLDSFLNARKSNRSSFGTTLLVPMASHPPVNLSAFIWHTWSATFVKSCEIGQIKKTEKVRVISV